MSTIPKCRPLVETLLSEFDSLTRTFVDDLRCQCQEKISESWLTHFRCTARHFLIWLNLTGTELRTVDGSIIHRFLQHDCRCGVSCASVPSIVGTNASHRLNS